MPKLDLSDPLSVMDIVFAITNDYGTTTYHRPSAVIKNDKTGMWSVEFSDNEVLTADTNRWPANNQHRPADWVLHSGHWWPINCPDRFPGVLEGEILAEYVERVIYDAPKADELSEEDWEAVYDHHNRILTKNLEALEAQRIKSEIAAENRRQTRLRSLGLL